MDGIDLFLLTDYLKKLDPRDRTETFMALAMEGYKVTVTYTPDRGGVREDFIIITYSSKDQKKKRH